MWKNILIGVLLLTGISSCNDRHTTTSQGPVFATEADVATHILTDTALIAYPYDLCVDDSCLYVLSLVADDWVQVYDKYSGGLLCSGIKAGQGPDEVASGASLCFDRNTKLFYLYDQGQSKLITFSFDKKEKRFLNVNHRSFAEYKGTVRRVWPLDAGRYLIDGQQGRNTNRMQRFQLYDADSLIARYDSFPVSDGDKDIVFVLASKALSPDKKKFAVGTLWGGTLETFRISDRITPVSEQCFAPIDILFAGGVVRPTEQTVYGFTSLVAFDNRIYGIWIGDKDPNHTSSIVAFDWDGNGISKYNTDCILLKMNKEAEDSRRIYAIAASKEKGFYIVYFDVKD